MNSQSSPQPEPAPVARPERPTTSPPTYSFAELARGGRQILVENEGDVYHLRLTKNGKLVLNK